MTCLRAIGSGLIILCWMLSVSGCATFNLNEYSSAFKEVNGYAEKHMENNEYPQSLILYRSLFDAEPTNTDITKKLDGILENAPELSRLLSKKMLGSNITDRMPNKDFGLGGKIALYLPNRILDILDIITCEVGICLGLGAGFKATEYVTAGAQVSSGEALIGLNRRHFSGRGTMEEYIELFPVEARAIIEARAYTGGIYSMMYTSAGLKNPEDTIFQRARDFWALSASAEALIVATRVEVHPIEFWDFFAGWLMFDPLCDDMGTSKAIKLTDTEKNALIRLSKQVKARGKMPHQNTVIAEE